MSSLHKKNYSNFLQVKLPESTATEAVYWLAGALPIEAQYHNKILTLLGSICRLPRTHPLHMLANRQLAIRDNRKSWKSEQDWWTIRTWSTKQLYFPWTKLAWKGTIKGRISSYWHIPMFSSSIEKTSLQWLIIEDSPPVGPHSIWKFSNDSDAREYHIPGHWQLQKAIESSLF